MWQSRTIQLLRSTCELSLRESNFFFAQHRNMAATSALQPHMRQAVVEISQRMRSVDLVIEMRDARIPHTSANYNLINLIRGKRKRLLLLNKADLAHKRFRKETLLELESSDQKVLFTCTSSKSFAKEVLAAVRMCLPGAESIPDRTPSKGYSTANGSVHVVMVVGTPNVGKTSLINALRQHARTQGLLDVQKAGQLPVGPLPGVTKHVSGIKVSDNPTMLLIDTPGVMLPRLTASTFAYRVALAGLVQETQVQLPELFAFTLYVMAQSPNKSQLKAVLAEPIPEEDAAIPQGSRPVAGTQATIRWAYASKRAAKCILQAIDEVLASSTQNTPTRDELRSELEQDVCAQHETSCDLVSSDNVHSRSELLPQGHSGDGKGIPEDGRLQQLSSQQIPRLAGDYLAMLHSSRDPSDSACANLAVEPVKGVPRHVDHTAELPDVRVGALKKVRQTGVPMSGHWEPFEGGLWAVCGEILLRKLVKRTRPDLEPPVEQTNAAMERVVRLVRAGHLGKLVFEEPKTKGQGQVRPTMRSRLSVAASQVPIGHMDVVN